jgi:cystathionine beta-lyase/cystathionine gamma-synthase
VRDLLERQSLAACFCEIPGNPLLGSADVRKITPLLRAHRVPLVVDDVVATPCNVDLNPYADLVATSLTKYLVGTGDAMGGALIVTRATAYGEPGRSSMRGTRNCSGVRTPRFLRPARTFWKVRQHNAKASISQSGCVAIRKWNASGIRSGSTGKPTMPSAGLMAGTAL